MVFANLPKEKKRENKKMKELKIIIKMYVHHSETERESKAKNL